MLPGSGLGNDTCFTHALSQQCLTECVVDFMGPSVIQIFSFEIDLGSTAVRTQSRGVVERRGSANIMFQKAIKRFLKFRVAAGFMIFSG